jgi:hypothetical protein
MLLGRRVPLRGCSGMVYFGSLNDLTHLLEIERSSSINSGAIILFSIHSFGTPVSCIPVHRYGFFQEYSKEDFFWLAGKEAEELTGEE